MKISRRNFLKTAAYSAGSTALPLSLSLPANAMTGGSGDYKAMVCLFLYGGNDSFNMLVPANGNNLTNYQNSRPGIQLYDFERATMPGFMDESGQEVVLNGSMPQLAQLMLSGAATTVSTSARY
ncbi:twin-arginine translocation signal domain-containing protein [Vibrio mexicanus]|uniref:twin-arginine translocation signal domain-containing protein n=1 Tax=Vibrio mexicanus TaxID=1004326 RepID=UPI000A9A4399|nr:twin-arginine translocation signal domain-containing protein [Vibrio mexicanus]